MPDNRIEYKRVRSWPGRRFDGKEGMESSEADGVDQATPGKMMCAE